MSETPLSAIKAARSVQSLPDGTAASPRLKHALLVLATYFPNVWPSQERLATDLGVSRRTVNRRLAELEELGFVTRVPRSWASTLYLLRLPKIRACAVPPSVTGRPKLTAEETLPEEVDYLEGL